MACVRCDFYIPAQSSQAQLLEAGDALQRTLVRIPLTDDGRAAVEVDQSAVAEAIEKLADVATAAGPTPRALSTGDAQPRTPSTGDTWTVGDDGTR
jgi:hypothetical protein